MNEFFFNQIDIINFINGLVFMIIGASCIDHRRQKTAIDKTGQKVNWNWFAAFAMCYGVNIWMDNFVIGFPSLTALAWINPIITGMAYFLLFRFGLSIFAFNSKTQKIINYLSILFAVISGLDETPLFNIGFKLLVALIGGALTLHILWKSAKQNRERAAYYWLALIGIFFYTLIFSSATLSIPWFADGQTVSALFKTSFGYPIELVQMAMAIITAIGIWFARKPVQSAPWSKGGKLRLLTTLSLFAGIGLVCVAASLLVQNQSAKTSDRLNESLLDIAGQPARLIHSLDHENISEAGAQPSGFIQLLDNDYTTGNKILTQDPAYRKILVVFNKILADYPTISNIKLIKPVADRRFSILMEAGRKSTNSQLSLAEICGNASCPVNLSQKPGVYGPIKDANNEMVGLVPILDNETGLAGLYLAINVNYLKYHEAIVYERIITIIPFLFIALALIFLIIRSRQKAAALPENDIVDINSRLSWFAPSFGLLLVTSAFTFIIFVQLQEDNIYNFQRKFVVLADSGVESIKTSFDITLVQLYTVANHLAQGADPDPAMTQEILAPLSGLGFDNLELFWLPAISSKKNIAQQFSEDPAILDKADSLKQALVLPQPHTTGDRQYLQLLVPIFVQAQTHPKGYMVIKFSIDKLFNRTLHSDYLDSLVFEIQDQTPSSGWGTFYRFHPFNKDYLDNSIGKGLAFVTPIDYADRLFYLTAFPSKDMIDKNPPLIPRLVLFFGLCASLIFSFYIAIIIISRQRAKLEAARRTLDLVKERDRLEKYIDMSAIFAIAFDAGGRLTLTNKKAREILALSDKAKLNFNWIKRFVGEGYRQTLTVEIANLLSGKRTASGDISLSIIDSKGNPHQLICRFAKLKYEEANIVIGTGIDVTELNRARVTIDELVEFDRIKNEIINITSHEFKTPLVSIIGLSEVMDKNRANLPLDFQRYVEIIHKESIRLNNLIKKMLVVAKNEQGKVLVNFKPLILGTYINSLKNTFAAFCEPKKVTIRYELENVSAIFTSDPELLSEILLNFLDNAIKYGPAKQLITIKSAKHDKFLRLAVIDNGPGIAKDKQSKLFEKFSQLDSSPTRSQEGIGLGLYICKQNSRSLGANVGVESEPGKGASFYIDLPLNNNLIL